jgi:hypothetical protein
VAIQRTAGNATFACWKNGVPVNSFQTYGGGFVTGPEWANIYGMKAFTQFIFGNPLFMSNTSCETWSPTSLNALLDDIVIRNDAPYTPGVAFTPTAEVWGANSRQLMTGV